MAEKKNQGVGGLEKSLAELETLVEKLEDGDLSLEETLKHFERGVKLTRECQTTLKEAEQKGEQIHQAALQEAQEITQNAQRRAYEIMEEAEALVINRREGADQYARETLFELEERLAGVLAQVRRGIDTLGLEVDVKIPS